MLSLRAILPLCAALATAACTGTTGGDLLTFDAFAAGPVDAKSSQPFTFTSGLGYRISLTRAKVHVAAVYLNRARPVSGAQATSCILPGIYVAEVTRGLEVDALSPDPQPFPARGEATADHAIVGEVWLGGGDVNAIDDPTVVLDVAGTAERDGASYPFTGALTIGRNRAIPPVDPAQPGANPICKQRIVSPIPVDITPRAGEHLLVRVDPRGIFTTLDFSTLKQTSDNPPLYELDDQADELYRGLRSTQGTYSLTFGQESMGTKENTP